MRSAIRDKLFLQHPSPAWKALNSPIPPKLPSEKNEQASRRESRDNRDLRALEQWQDNPGAATAASILRGESQAQGHPSKHVHNPRRRFLLPGRQVCTPLLPSQYTYPS